MWDSKAGAVQHLMHRNRMLPSLGVVKQQGSIHGEVGPPDDNIVARPMVAPLFRWMFASVLCTNRATKPEKATQRRRAPRNPRANFWADAEQQRIVSISELRDRLGRLQPQVLQGSAALTCYSRWRPEQPCATEAMLAAATCSVSFVALRIVAFLDFGNGTTWRDLLLDMGRLTIF